MSTRYAEGTKVPAAQSRAEIESTLERFGAEAFGYVNTPDRAAVEFHARGRRIRLVLPLPTMAEVARTATGRRRSPSEAQAALQQEVRRRWRALALVVKSKLEAVTTGIVTFEDEWLAHTVLPSGLTVAEELNPQIEEAVTAGRIAPLQIGGPHRA